jgi:8-oxo-dGTP pyrophosphatase MutT (NUDIX family)/phosphohistidine phosphatase SixA
MGDPDRRATIRAGGAVLWRPGGAGLEVAVIHRPRYDDWSFPKGKLKNGEHLLRAVVREVEEEAGVRPRLGRRLSPRRYLKGDRPKRVDYWAATGEGAGDSGADAGTGDDGAGAVGDSAIGGGAAVGRDAAARDVRARAARDGGAAPARVPTDEVDRVEWLPLPAAEARLSYERDVELLREFAAGPVRTVPYVILRHGSAGEKRAWTDDDTLRPLDSRGREEAADLAEMLSFFGPARVISSATARCVETVLPYAARAGVDIRTDQAFTDAVSDSARAADALRALVAEQVPTVVCTHGELVPNMIAGASRALGAAVPDDPGLRKGAFWVLHVAGEELATAERHACRP